MATLKQKSGRDRLIYPENAPFLGDVDWFMVLHRQMPDSIQSYNASNLNGDIRLWIENFD